MGHPSDIFSIEPSDGFICAICHDVLKDASTFKECGHTFCGDCINTLCIGDTPQCPNCRVAVTGSIPNYSMRDVIDAMKVKCPHWNCDVDDGGESRNKRQRCENDEDVAHSTSGRGCGWTGVLRDLKVHEKECGFETITCSVNGCEHICKRMYMESHLSSGAGIMKHMELMYENRLKEMEQKYDEKIKKLKLETLHLKYLNECRVYIDNCKEERAFLPSASIHPIRNYDIAGDPITGLFCGIPCKGTNYPMTIRYDSAYDPPTCIFPSGFFHLNVCHDGSLQSDDFHWYGETTLKKVLHDVKNMLECPKWDNICQEAAGGVFRAGGKKAYFKYFRGRSTKKYPKSWDKITEFKGRYDLFEEGEDADCDYLIPKSSSKNSSILFS